MEEVAFELGLEEWVVFGLGMQREAQGVQLGLSRVCEGWQK